MVCFSQTPESRASSLFFRACSLSKRWTGTQMVRRLAGGSLGWSVGWQVSQRQTIGPPRENLILKPPTTAFDHRYVGRTNDATEVKGGTSLSVNRSVARSSPSATTAAVSDSHFPRTGTSNRSPKQACERRKSITGERK